MYYTLFIIFVRRKKLIAIVNWVSPQSYLSKLFIMSFKYTLFFKDILQLIVFVSMTVTFIIVTPQLVFSYWFAITFFILKVVSDIFNYFIFDCFIIFFSPKIFLTFLIAVSSIFYPKKIPYPFNYIVYYSFISFNPWTFHHYRLEKKSNHYYYENHH